MAEIDEIMRYIDETAAAATASLDRSTRPVVGPVVAPRPSLQQNLDEAKKHVVVDALPSQTRLRFLKRVVLRLARGFTHPQVAFNQSTVATLDDVLAHITLSADKLQALMTATADLHSRMEEMQTRLNRHADELSRGLATAQAGIASNEIATQDISETLEHVDREMATLRQEAADLSRQRVADRSELLMTRARVDMMLRELRGAASDPDGAQPSSALQGEFESRMDVLYAEFETAFRGSSAEIAKRQEQYLDCISSLKGSPTPVLDIGSGRGEWLTLLRDHGIPAYGVDINGTFVALGRQQGLDVRHEDAIAHLNDLPEGSLGAVSAFHLVEHMELIKLIELIDAALCALRPGGKLILETPNPTNLLVGAASFYLDPTHIKPIHPSFLEFLVSRRGFAEAETRFLNPSAENPFVIPSTKDELVDGALTRVVEHLNWAFFGPQDYGVIGTKASAP